MTKVEIFERAIKEFGVDAALEYFCTPNEKRYLFDKLKKKKNYGFENRLDKVCIKYHGRLSYEPY